MKITMKDFKDNAGIGVGAGVAVSVIFYFINKNYVKAIDKIDKDDIEMKELILRNAEKELDELEYLYKK